MMKWGVGGLAALGLGLSFWIWRGLQSSAREERERAAAFSLKMLASAEADFRGNDRDGNKIQDFWTGDLAGLYYLPDLATGKPLALIEKGVADADARPVREDAMTATPDAGYYFAALEADDSVEPPAPYAADTRGEPSRGPYYNHSKFGFCAYPADYPRSGRWTYLINEGNTVIKIDTGGKPVTRWPRDQDACKDCLQRPHPGKCWKGKLD